MKRFGVWLIFTCSGTWGHFHPLAAQLSTDEEANLTHLRERKNLQDVYTSCVTITVVMFLQYQLSEQRHMML